MGGQNDIKRKKHSGGGQKNRLAYGFNIFRKHRGNNFGFQIFDLIGLRDVTLI